MLVRDLINGSSSIDCNYYSIFLNRRFSLGSKRKASEKRPHLTRFYNKITETEKAVFLHALPAYTVADNGQTGSKSECFVALSFHPVLCFQRGKASCLTSLMAGTDGHSALESWAGFTNFCADEVNYQVWQRAPFKNRETYVKQVSGLRDS